ncbi:MAG: hypothetical protein KC621_10800 [Myxococcales bacterium]|nr:hypothetical protein [Myxococcales bacterium]
MLFLLTALTPAHAILIGGNPNVGVSIDNVLGQYDDGSVYITKVRAMECGGGYTDYTINKWVDPVAGYTLTIDGGDLCNIRYYFGSPMTLHGTNANGAFTVTYDEPYGTIDIDPEIATPALTPYTVPQGATSIAPRAYLSLE